MMSRRREKFWYHVSEKLGIEITLMGVGSWAYIPGQFGTAVAFETEDGETAPWMKRAIDRRRETPWWFHTHPNMNAFISTEDVRGAHALWDMIRRPFKAIVVGDKSNRAEVRVNESWIKRHPAPPPPPPLKLMTHVIKPHGFGRYSGFPSRWWCSNCGGFDGQHRPGCQDFRGPYGSNVPPLMLPPMTMNYAKSLRSSISQPNGLLSEISYLMQKYGTEAVYDSVDQIITERYADRQLSTTGEEDAGWNG